MKRMHMSSSSSSSLGLLGLLQKPVVILLLSSLLFVHHIHRSSSSMSPSFPILVSAFQINNFHSQHEILCNTRTNRIKALTIQQIIPCKGIKVSNRFQHHHHYHRGRHYNRHIQIQHHHQQQQRPFSIILYSNANVADSIDSNFENNKNNKEQTDEQNTKDPILLQETLEEQLQPSSSSSSQSKEPQLTSKAFNASFLILCFGFAAYSILTVDDGMTRGWSMAEKAMRIPLDNWSSYESSLNQQPVFTKTTINVVIYLLGDWLSQTLFIKRNLLEFDAWRTLRNGFIGMVFGPLVHQYYEFSDYILPVDAAMINRVYKIFMDQTIYIFVKCTMYIIAVNMLAGESWEYSRDEARGKIKNIMFTAWKFWPLVHCVTYGAIPARHRILWVNCVDLFWNAILASLASGESSDDEDSDNLKSDMTNDLNHAGNTTIVSSDIIDAVEAVELIPNSDSNVTTFNNNDNIAEIEEDLQTNIKNKQTNKEATKAAIEISIEETIIEDRTEIDKISNCSSDEENEYEKEIDLPDTHCNDSEKVEFALNTTLTEA